MFGLSVTRLSLAPHSPVTRPAGPCPVDPTHQFGYRAQLLSTVGPAYRLVEQRGKAKLDVRYADGSRGTAVLPVQWVPAQARQIQEAVERVAQQLSMGRTLRQSLELIEGASSPRTRTCHRSSGARVICRLGGFRKAQGSSNRSDQGQHLACRLRQDGEAIACSFCQGSRCQVAADICGRSLAPWVAAAPSGFAAPLCNVPLGC